MTLPPPRIMAALMLARVNISAAESLASQNQFGDWAMTASDPGELVCKGERDKLPASFTPANLAGINAYPFLVVGRELSQPKMNIRARLGKLHVLTIALVSPM